MKRKQPHYPSKATLNLAMREKSQFAPGKLIPLLLLLVALAGGFGKFAVADRLTQVSQAEAALYALQQQRSELEAATADYDTLLEEFSRYSVSWMSEEEKSLIPRSDILALIEDELMPNSQVLRFSSNGNLLSAELGGITLEDTSCIVQRLYQLPNVVNVSVYTASSKTQAGNQTSVSMVITMTVPQEGGEQK